MLVEKYPMRKSEIWLRCSGGRSAATIAQVWRFLLCMRRSVTMRVCYPMAGVIPASAINTGKLVRFGYVMLTERRELPPGGYRLRGVSLL